MINARKPGKKSIVMGALLFVTIGIVVGVVTYIDRIAPGKATVLVVNDESIDMDYLIKRVRMAGGSPVNTLQTISREEVVRQVAGLDPHNIRVNNEEVDEYLRNSAGEDELSEEEFEEWYRQKLNETRLSDEEYRELARTELLIRRLSERVAGEVPDYAEQVHVFAISVADSDSLAEVEERLDQGDSFRRLAQEVGSDRQLADADGELGWFPEGVLPANLNDVAFERLDVGEVSDPVRFGEQMLLLKVAERTEREVGAESRRLLQAVAFEEWLADEVRKHDVEFHGLENGYDMETNDWVWSQAQALD